MENKAKYTVVGIFVLTFTISMILFILWLARYDVEELNAKEFRIYSEASIAGLNKNSIVEYKGLDIGLVDNIRINPKNVEQIEIILKITKPEIIKTNSYAIIQSQGVTGNKLIEIEGGTQDAKQVEVKENSFAVLPLKKSFIDKLTSSAGNISSQIEVVLKRFELLLDDKNIENIEKLLDNLNKSSDNFNQLITNSNQLLKNDVKTTVSNVNKMTKSIDNVVKNDVSKTLKEIEKLSKNLSLLSENIDNVLKNDVKDLISDFSNTAKSSQSIEKVLGDLEQTIEKIDSTIESFNSNGGDMIFNTREKNFGPGELK